MLEKQWYGNHGGGGGGGSGGCGDPGDGGSIGGRGGIGGGGSSSDAFVPWFCHRNRLSIASACQESRPYVVVACKL